MSEWAEPQSPGRIFGALAAAVRRESVLFLAGVGLVAIHVLDDNFVQPQPGTSAGDHLVSGLVPLAVLALAAAVYVRARPGLRAAVALPLGVLGIVAGVEGAYYTAKVEPSGDDYTGLLAIPAGVLLLGVGAATLWRTRRKDDSLSRRYLRRFVIAVGAIVLTAFVLFPISLAYVVTHTARAVVPPADLGAAYEQVAFTTGDGLRLEGWFVPSRNGATVIAFPGRKGPQKHARMLVRHGYGVLLFDRRGEGESEGDPNTFGWAGVEDLHAAVAFLRSRPDVDPGRIGGIGLSVGGEMLIDAAARSDALEAVVSEGGSGRSVRDVLATPGGGAGRFAGVVNNAMATAATAIFTNDLPPPSLESLVPQIAPRAVFFVYATDGQGGSEEAPNREFYAAAGAPKAIWEVPEGGHTGGITARPREYERRVIEFFDRALLER